MVDSRVFQVSLRREARGCLLTAPAFRHITRTLQWAEWSPMFRRVSCWALGCTRPQFTPTSTNQFEPPGDRKLPVLIW